MKHIYIPFPFKKFFCPLFEMFCFIFPNFSIIFYGLLGFVSDLKRSLPILRFKKYLICFYLIFFTCNAGYPGIYFGVRYKENV